MHFSSELGVEHLFTYVLTDHLVTHFGDVSAQFFELLVYTFFLLRVILPFHSLQSVSDDFIALFKSEPMSGRDVLLAHSSAVSSKAGNPSGGRGVAPLPPPFLTSGPTGLLTFKFKIGSR